MTILLLGVLLPSAPLLWQIRGTPNGSEFVGAVFDSALRNSAVMSLLVTLLSLATGFPCGVLSALYEFPARRVLMALIVLPLLLPSFLWAIGWESLAARFGAPAITLVSGVSGCVLVFLAQATPLVFLATYAAAMSVSETQLDAARLAGGERVVFLAVGRTVAIPALLTAGLGGVLTLSDPGPGQILGLKTAASEILTSFAALYDFPLAGRQCVNLTVLVLMVTAPLACFAAPRLANEILVRQVRAARRAQHGMPTRAVLIIFILLAVGETLAPLVGLTLSVGNGDAFLRAWRELSRTALNTLLYAAGAGMVAVVIGFLLAGCIGRNDRLRTSVVGIVMALFSLPPALTALGLVQLAAATPAWADPFLRSRFTVCIALGLRFSPVAVMFAFRSWGAASSTWIDAAAVHGVSLSTYLWRVMFPVLRPTAMMAGLLVALLAVSDMSTVLLLHPPGERSLPLAIFTVMANAPEALIASLCLVYVVVAAGCLMMGWTLVRRLSP